MYCDKFKESTNGKAHLSEQMPYKDINTLVINMKEIPYKAGLRLPIGFLDNLNIGNLYIKNSEDADTFPGWKYTNTHFNRNALKVLTFNNVRIGQPHDWELFKGSSVTSIHFEGGFLEHIDFTFGDFFDQLEFAYFTECHIKNVLLTASTEGINAFEKMKKLKFLTISHTQIEDIDWLFVAKDGFVNQILVKEYTELVRLDLSFNKITSIQFELFEKTKAFPKLRYLNLRGNKILQKSMTPFIPLCNQLKELWVDKDNKFKDDSECQKVKIFYT